MGQHEGFAMAADFAKEEDIAVFGGIPARQVTTGARGRRAGGSRHRARSSPAPAPDGDHVLALALQREEEATWAQGMVGLGYPAPGGLLAQRDDNVDVDNMSYDELLALGERVGYASRPNKPSPSQLARLPTRVISDGRSSKEEEQECNICCCSYEAGEELRTLPCMHMFHCDCIDKWLTSDMPGARKCPICHCEVEL